MYSRTLDQQEGFCRELSKVDRLILLPIYAARENPIDGFNTQSIIEKISKDDLENITNIKNEISELIESRTFRNDVDLDYFRKIDKKTSL